MELICVLARDCTKVLTLLSFLVLVSVIFIVCSVCLSLPGHEPESSHSVVSEASATEDSQTQCMWADLNS